MGRQHQLRCLMCNNTHSSLILIYARWSPRPAARMNGRPQRGCGTRTRRMGTWLQSRSTAGQGMPRPSTPCIPLFPCIPSSPASLCPFASRCPPVPPYPSLLLQQLPCVPTEPRGATVPRTAAEHPAPDVCPDVCRSRETAVPSGNWTKASGTGTAAAAGPQELRVPRPAGSASHT